MPSRNVLKIDVESSYYHVYARGNSKQQIFADDVDYKYFVGLFARYLSTEPTQDKSGVSYPHYCGRVELLTYCLMDNHFHLLVWQKDVGDMSQFMRSVMTSYSRYFNLRYKRSGSLFESRYKASRIEQDEYLLHISRYIHLNPRYWQRYPHSSLRYYFSNEVPPWLKPEKITDLFANKEGYYTFLKDYEDHKLMLEEIKYDLADQ